MYVLFYVFSRLHYFQSVKSFKSFQKIAIQKTMRNLWFFVFRVKTKTQNLKNEKLKTTFFEKKLKKSELQRTQYQSQISKTSTTLKRKPASRRGHGCGLVFAGEDVGIRMGAWVSGRAGVRVCWCLGVFFFG